jgi:D-alanyl-D-alanine dipeptidase
MIKQILIIILLLVNVISACVLEEKIKKRGLIDIHIVDPTIKVEIIHATTKNMLGVNSYECFTKCYLQPDVVAKLIKAQKKLQKLKPGYSLKIFEGTRPRSVQRKMYAVVKNTSFEKYVANPDKGSMHNYGTAVDVTIVDKKGNELKMGLPDPRIKIVGRSELEISLLIALNRPGKLEKANRELLKKVMIESGFIPLSYEWWHFDGFAKEYVRRNFNVIE